MGRDEQILQAACQLFYERGFAAVGVDEIGTVAGVSGPAIYRHFPSKHDILAALLDQTLDSLLERVGGTASDPREQLRHLIRGHLGYVLENPALAVVHHRETRSLENPFRSQWRRRETRYVARWTDCLRRCYPEADAREASAATAALMHLLNSVPEWPGEARKVPDLVELVSSMALSMADVLRVRGVSKVEVSR